MPTGTNGPTQDDELHAEVRDLSRRFGTIEVRLGTVEVRLGTVEATLGGVVHRLEGVETRLGGVEQRVASVESTLQFVATKADLHQALNVQTWKIVGFGVTIVAAAFVLARYL